MKQAVTSPLGQVIKERRIKLGLSQRQLAERALVSQAEISKIERGNTPSQQLLGRICEVLGLDLKEVATGTLQNAEYVEAAIEELQVCQILQQRIPEGMPYPLWKMCEMVQYGWGALKRGKLEEAEKAALDVIGVFEPREIGEEEEEEGQRITILFNAYHLLIAVQNRASSTDWRETEKLGEKMHSLSLWLTTIFGENVGGLARAKALTVLAGTRIRSSDPQDWKQAWDTASQALDLGPDPETQMSGLRWRASSARQLEDHTKKSQVRREVIDAVNANIGSPIAQSKALQGVALCYAQSNNDLAQEMLVQAREIFDKIWKIPISLILDDYWEISLSRDEAIVASLGGKIKVAREKAQLGLKRAQGKYHRLARICEMIVQNQGRFDLDDLKPSYLN
jgi:transcriptional regulator with XRE-family HTH domain